jgi:hypothetical protein
MCAVYVMRFIALCGSHYNINALSIIALLFIDRCDEELCAVRT